MATLTASNLRHEEIAQLEQTYNALPPGVLRSTLEQVLEDLRQGENIVVLGSRQTLTPAEAARILGISRAHLCKLLDLGAVPFHIVGARDRRIQARDLVAYRKQLHEAQRATATLFAQSDADDDALLDELASNL
jgi:excisionase family DNA binding protein